MIAYNKILLVTKISKRHQMEISFNIQLYSRLYSPNKSGTINLFVNIRHSKCFLKYASQT